MHNLFVSCVTDLKFKVTLQGESKNQGHSETQGHTSRSPEKLKVTLQGHSETQGHVSMLHFKVGIEGQLSRSFGTEGRRSRASQNIQTRSTCSHCHFEIHGSETSV
ncbi:unnamed protein product [Acanthoscelides obtectus]|uniref:Uncharacterized protein n=1 Tax=Acanthoscelides obtectus TaxID=200917 RepID=A0A9P0Q6C1_ACAOB|nr:unnamed protein product [Acanthoscelides obtectus]CAK1656048.1 hypothetical protein AOBTE_LOCUS19544 [Acanthoscelides obtectus]